MTGLTNVINQNDNILFRYKSLTQKNLEIKRILNYKRMENNIPLSIMTMSYIFDMKIFELNIL